MPQSNDTRKAAIVLMSLPADAAADLLAMLDPREVEAVLAEISKNEAISDLEQRSVILEFTGVDPATISTPRGGADAALHLVERAFGTPDVPARARRRLVESRPLGFLGHVNSRKLRSLVENEHPQTIALILSQLPGPRSAALISLLTDDERATIIRRVAGMEAVNPEIVRDVARVMRSRLATVRLLISAGRRAATASRPPSSRTLARRRPA